MNYHKIPADQVIRICFLGCGKICNKHASLLKKMNHRFQLSFASRGIEKAKAYRLKHQGQLAFASYEEAIASNDIDVIMITTPPDSHYLLCKQALLSRKHVIVEKPPFYTSEAFKELGTLAEENQLQLLIAENYYYKPLRKAIANLMMENIIGRPIFININATKKQKNDDWRDDEAVTKYGALFEGGIHWVNFINNIGLHLKNEKGFVNDRNKKLERSIQIIAESDEGPIVNLFYSWEIDTIFKGLRICRIYGTEGSITFEANGLFIFVRGKKIRFKIPDIKNITGFRNMFDDFHNALKSGKAPALSWQMAIKDLELIEKVYHYLKSE